MRIAITGASGLIGSELVPHLRASQHEVIRLVRRDPTAADEVRWGPDTGFVGDLGDIDAVVQLAGAGVASCRGVGAAAAQQHQRHRGIRGAHGGERCGQTLDKSRHFSGLL